MTATVLAVKDDAMTPSVDPKSARDLRLLVVDDSELDRQRVLRLCARAGLRFKGVEAGTLDEMRAALDETSFDLVFIDYLLAGDTGIDALEILTAHPRQADAAAIMIAGEGQIDVAVDAMRKGCSDYTTKAQMTVDSVRKSIATALERRMVSAMIEGERAARFRLENSIQSYANACTESMRSILSATLRRVRTLRGYDAPGLRNYGRELGLLEQDINRLWQALPEFRDAVAGSIAETTEVLELTVSDDAPQAPSH